MNFMGFDTKNSTEINGKIWLYKNFLSEDECKIEIEKIKNGNINKITDNGAKQINFDNKFIKDKLIKLMKEDAYIGDIAAYDTPINKFWALHTDLEGETNKNYNKQWGIVGYLIVLKEGSCYSQNMELLLNQNQEILLYIMQVIAIQ